MDYSKIRKVNQEIAMLNGKHDEEEKCIVEVACALAQLAKHVECNGQCILRDMLEKITSDVYGKELCYFLELVIKGVDANQIREIAEERYEQKSHSGYEGLMHILIVEGCLCIQKRDMRYLLIEKLCSMMPEDLASRFVTKGEGFLVEVAEEPLPIRMEPDSDFMPYQEAFEMDGMVLQSAGENPFFSRRAPEKRNLTLEELHAFMQTFNHRIYQHDYLKFKG